MTDPATAQPRSYLLLRVDRLLNSPSGNPTWLLYFEHLAIPTKLDTQFGFEVSEAMVGKRWVIHTDPSGRRVIDLTPADVSPATTTTERNQP